MNLTIKIARALLCSTIKNDKSAFGFFFSIIIAGLILSSSVANAQSRIWSMTEQGENTNSGSMFNIDLSGVNYNSVPFTMEYPGAAPNGSLVQGTNGLLYGMTSIEGMNQKGVIFSYDYGTGTYTDLFDFGGNNGENPHGSLVLSSNGLLYGMTANGGLNGNGVLFSFNITTNTFTKLYDFGTTDGSKPQGSLFEASNGLLYGFTELGGVNSTGVLFSFNTTGNTYSKVYDFGGLDGENPRGSLNEISGGILYGLTSNGGQNNGGVIFSYNLNFSVFTKLFDFGGVDGTNPSGTLIESANGSLYGVTQSGGLNSYGVLFRYNPTTNVYSKMIDFDGVNGNGPQGSLIKAPNGLLYGMAALGGVNNFGTVYTFNTITNILTKIYDFNRLNGAAPAGDLFLANNSMIYGLTSAGGISGNGVMFSLNYTGNTITKLLNFTSSSKGSFPWGSLIQAPNGLFYGMTSIGGASNTGIIFGYHPGTNTFTKLFDFDTLNGQHPYGSLLRLSNGVLYGMTKEGGVNGFGVIFSYNPATSTFSKLYDFDGTNGKNPIGSLILATNGLLYGTAQEGGLNNYGVIFSFNTTNNTFTNVYDFDGTSGELPSASLVQTTSGLLFGMTTNGGLNSSGVIFGYSTSNNTYSKLFDFSTANGTHPKGSLKQASNGLLYGMTSDGGVNSDGVLFSFNQNNYAYTKLLDFNGVNGQAPMGTLMQASNGVLYGMTTEGGTNNKGVIFKYNITTSTYSKLRDLNLPDGTTPRYSSFYEAPGINTGSLATNHYCLGESLVISYTADGPFGATNVFTAQLSDANGNFASPVNLGSVTSTTSGTIPVTIPLNTPPGSHYRIRVVGGLPVTFGSDNGNDFAVNANTSSFQIINTCDNYTWNGTNYTTSGVYQAHLINAAGCDSTANLTLSIKHSNSSTTTITACDSLVWNGTTYTASGSYSKHFNNLVGCDSTANLNLTIKHSSVSNTTAVGCDSYTWNGITYNASGYYTAFLHTTSGCDSTANLNLTINSTSSSNTAITSCNSYTWNGMTYTASGNYTAHFTNSVGCDSSANLALTINRSTYSNTIGYACDSYTWNGNTYTTTGLYTAHFINALGCDSTANLDLTVSHNLNINISNAACDSFTFNGTTYTTSGIYTAHYVTPTGCDSVINLNLTINHPTVSNNTLSSCDSLHWNGTAYTVSGSYTAHLTNAAGCDSTANLLLTITHSSSSSSSATACDSYTWNGTTYNSSGNYSAHFTNAEGCDSTASITLTINQSTSSNDSATACGSYDWNGKTYTLSGNYSDTLLNSAGCDSIAYLALTVNSGNIDTGIVQIGSNILMAHAVNASYQWIHCGGIILPGEINQTYIANSPGAYAVIVTVNGCSDTSECIVLTIGIVENDLRNQIRIYPNPASGKFNLDFGNAINENSLVEISDLTGRIVFRSESRNQKIMEIKLNTAPGIYLMTVTGKYKMTYKVVID